MRRSRKRYVKLLMAEGISRNHAVKNAERVRELGYSYWRAYQACPPDGGLQFDILIPAASLDLRTRQHHGWERKLMRRMCEMNDRMAQEQRMRELAELYRKLQ